MINDKIQNFTIESSNKPKTNFNIEMQVDSSVKNLAELDTDTIIADLERLANKHPEFFKKPSDAFKLLREIKENPTFFYKNNVPDIALIAKRLQNDDLDKIGIKKDNGEVRHLSKSKFEKENARLSKRNGVNPLVESPYSTQPVLSKDAEPTAMVHKELSKDNDKSISQNKSKSQVKKVKSNNFERTM